MSEPKRPAWRSGRTFQGKKVSFAWWLVLTEADEDINFTLTSGRRTMAEQQALFNQNMAAPGMPKPGRPLTAVPNRNAPHIRVGRPDHALDANSLDGGETRLEAWVERHGADWRNTVTGEAWHGEVPLTQLLRLALRIWNQRRRKQRKREERKRRLLKARAARRRKIRRKEIARKHGAHFVNDIYEVAEKYDIPFSLGLALVEKESNFINQYGHDRLPGQRPIWHGQDGLVRVTEENVNDYLRFAARTGQRQGVGLTQLTSGGFQNTAEKRGGLEKPRVQLDVGFELLANLMKQLGTFKGIGAYNGGPGNPQDDYARGVQALQRKWHDRLD